jgi:peptidoglycan/xylan/chitin deacetylase (PgdA/CDA1 family)
MFADTIKDERQGSSFAAAAARLQKRAAHRIARHLPLPPIPMRNSGPLVSFTFDDAPVSAYVKGAAALEVHGARATFYIATGLLGRRSDFWTVMDSADVADLYRRGHEIALHSHLHRSTSLITAAELSDDLARNAAILNGIDPGIRARNFAYPFGQCTLARKRQLSSLVRSSRSIYAGINRSFLDLHYIRSVELCDCRLTIESLNAYLAHLQRAGGWLVFTLHDISDAPSPHGCSVKLLHYALEQVALRGMRILSLDAALDAVLEPRAPVFSSNIKLSQELGYA